MAVPVMTKPFDTSVLLAMAEAEGVPMAEALLKTMIDSVIFPWVSQSLVLEAVKNPWVAIGVPILAAVQPVLDAELAKLIPSVPAP